MSGIAKVFVKFFFSQSNGFLFLWLLEFFALLWKTKVACRLIGLEGKDKAKFLKKKWQKL